MPSLSDRFNTGELRNDLRMGVFFAVGFSVAAVLAVAIGAFTDWVGLAEYSDWSEFPIGFPLIIAGYFAGGILGGVAFWLLRPLHDSDFGCILTGCVIGTIAFGSISLIGVLAYVHLNINIFDFESPRQAWNMWPWLSAVLGILIGGPLGFYYSRND